MIFVHYSELLRYYRKWIIAMFFGLVGGAAAISTLLLAVAPIYTATAKVNLLPTDSELAFSRTFVQNSSVNPANLLSQTHIEYILSREIAQDTIDRMVETLGPPPAQGSGGGGLKADLRRGFQWLKNGLRRSYNMLNSGKHVPIDPYTDTVLTLQDSITAEMIEGTYILEIAVSWSDPTVAAAAANMLAETYVERLRQQSAEAAQALESDLRAEILRNEGSRADLEKQIGQLRLAQSASIETLRVIDPAVPPIYPSFPKVVIYTLLAIAGWLALSALVVVSADTFSGTIKTSADLERILGAQALGTVRPRDLRRGRRARRRQDEVARRLRMQGALRATGAAVLCLGSDRENAIAAELVQKARSMHWSVPGPSETRPLQLWLQLWSIDGPARSPTPAPNQMPDWLLVAIPPGKVTEPQLRAVVRHWHDSGVPAVFGLIVVG